MEIQEEVKNKLVKVFIVLVIILSVYFVVKIFSEIKEANMIGESNQPATISFSGHGEVTAVSDIASVYFTISKDAKTVKEAQDGVAVIEKKALDFLRSKDIADKDIKTANASFYPKYEYKQAVCPVSAPIIDSGSTVSSSTYYCPSGKQVLVGYTASESITVKIRKTEDAGVIIQGLGTTGVSDLNGPNFTIDDEDAVKAEARKLAIDDAKAKAKILAKDLNVSLVKITNFYENSNGYPVMYATGMEKMLDSRAPAPAELPKGENTISSDVTITYEIR
jgi:hypothetical protein